MVLEPRREPVTECSGRSGPSRTPERQVQAVLPRSPLRPPRCSPVPDGKAGLGSGEKEQEAGPREDGR